LAAWGPEQLQIVPRTIVGFELVCAVDAAGTVDFVALLLELDEPHALSARATAQASMLIETRVTTLSLLL
jgi:hypothetical protein